MNTFDLIELDPQPPAGRNADATPTPGVLVAAQTDTELARAFLAHGMFAKATLKSTKTELGRFLLWCRDRQLRLVDLRVEDMAAYRDFLLDPQPREKWVSAPAAPGKPGTKWPRDDPRWRPFSGPLSVQSARQAFRVAKALTAFASATGYLDREPGSIVKNFKVRRNATVERYLGPATIAYVDAAIDALPRAPGQELRRAVRDQFLFVAFVTTGARLSEVAQATMGAIHLDKGRWWMTVTGKGDKPRMLPVCDELLECYRSYRAVFGLPASAHRGDQMPLVLSVRRNKPTGIGAEATGNAITELFMIAADVAHQAGDHEAEADLQSASAHWLRHEMITALVDHAGLKIGQDQGGHDNIATTGGYLHTLAAERHAAVVDLMRKRRKF